MDPRIVIAGVVLLAACGGHSASRPAAIQRGDLSAAAAARHQRLVEEGDALWRERASPADLEAAIDTWERALDLAEEDWRTHAKVSRALQLFGSLRRGAAVRAPIFERGFQVARRGLSALSPELERLVRSGVPMKDAIETVDREGAPLLYWYAANLGGYARASGAQAAMEYKDLFVALVQRVYELDPDYDRRGADRLLGAFYGAAPEFLGGDLARSRQHFETALDRAPNHLAAYVLMAEFYATRAGEEALFQRLLERVLEAEPCAAGGGSSPCVEPELELESQVQKRRARKLLEERDEHFPD